MRFESIRAARVGLAAVLLLVLISPDTLWARARLDWILRSPIPRAALMETAPGRRALERLSGIRVQSESDLVRAIAKIDAGPEARLFARRVARLESRALGEGALRMGASQRLALLGRLMRDDALFSATAAPHSSSTTLEFLDPAAGEAAGRLPPAAADSLEARFGSWESPSRRLYQAVTRSWDHIAPTDLDRLADALSSGLGRPATEAEIVREVLMRRQVLAAELQTLGEAYGRADPLTSRLFKRAAERIDATAQVWARARAQEHLRSFAYETGGPSINRLSGYPSSVPGETGELLVALRESAVAETGMRVKALGRIFGGGSAAHAARQELDRLAQVDPEVIGKEFDVFIEGGRVWGEVKNFERVMTSSDNQWEAVLQQAERAVRTRDLVNSSEILREFLGGPVELRSYFVGGITRSAAMRLQEMGITVFGIL
ncbi:MAG: hypothetical protein IT285_15065 [Bdellovibrionales bacterium]|nr:hypothetical protein [Bdellovibrionales bacterium]